jgi:hypothetical protein
MFKTIQERLREANLFTKLWVDRNDMKDNMRETVAGAIRESKIVFVLLSDAYCESDFCRREWEFALEEKIKTYVIVVQKDFNRKNYDWVRFNIGGELYYNMHKNDDFPQLIQHSGEFLNKKIEDKPKRNENTKETRMPSPPLPLTPKRSTGNPEYSKTPIDTWTPVDVQSWCTDNHLNNWHKPLTNFDGQNLLALRRDLTEASYVQCVVKENTLNGLDVSRLKSEVDKILLKTTTTHKPSTKENVAKRRTSKSSNK